MAPLTVYPQVKLDVHVYGQSIEIGCFLARNNNNLEPACLTAEGGRLKLYLPFSKKELSTDDARFEGLDPYNLYFYDIIACFIEKLGKPAHVVTASISMKTLDSLAEAGRLERQHLDFDMLISRLTRPGRMVKRILAAENGLIIQALRQEVEECEPAPDGGCIPSGPWLYEVYIVLPDYESDTLIVYSFQEPWP